MKQGSAPQRDDAFLMLDLIGITLFWFICYLIRFESGIIPIWSAPLPISKHLMMLPLVWVSWYVVTSFIKLYRYRTFTNGHPHGTELLKATTLTVLLLVTLTYMFGDSRYSRLTLIIFWVISTFGLFLMRRCAEMVIQKNMRKGKIYRNLLIIGSSISAKNLATRVISSPEMGFALAGFVSDTNIPNRVGEYKDLDEILKTHSIDVAVLALENSESHMLEPILSRLSEEMIDIQIIPNFSQHIAFSCEVELLNGLPMLRLNTTPMHSWNRLWKRLLDITVTALILIPAAPIMIILAAIIKLTSNGPVFYSQERTGLDGKTFKMLKFRSMKVEAEKDSGAVWAAENDPRRTWIGKIMRSTSLDELPQLINILKGEMSLVGPRPERPIFVEEFRKQVPKYMLRHTVKAGLTGWAQINGWRGNTSLEKRIEYDLFYIQNWSPWLDLKIILLTPFKGLIGRHAY